MTEKAMETVDVPCCDCGDGVEIAQPKCVECGVPIPDPDDLERTAVVEVSELRELIDEWRENGKVYESQDPDPVAERGRGMQGCANELEAVIGDE